MCKIQKSEDLIYIRAKLEIMQWMISISLAEAMIWIYRLSIPPLISGSMVALAASVKSETHHKDITGMGKLFHFTVTPWNIMGTFKYCAS